MSFGRLVREGDLLVRFLLRAEAEVALLSRVRPVRPPGELERVRESFLRGAPREPMGRLRPAPPLSELRGALELVATHLMAEGPLATLYAQRAGELALEAGIVEHLGTPAARDYCLRRFPEPRGEAGRQGHVWSAAWLEPAPPEAGPRYASDDASAPESLGRQVEAELRRLRLSARVMFDAALQSKAAVAEGVVLLRPGVLLSADEARRIAAHEVRGHVLPRERARSEPLGLLRVGTGGAADDEEGRALLIERRLGLLTGARRFELALRHQAARWVRSGASFVEVVETALALGADLGSAVELADRALRGGGLGRELVYLPRLHEVERAFAAEPGLEAWFERGRVSVSAARVLSAREAQSSLSSASTGA
ncbi:MAG: DUF1704 domain-containing protein [Polyangiaceae bacterium]|nr:DUF1704 domain-containing protein [Polyangiaceae bacterium]MCW5790498.1 DUF1704 domain-containing protein [Polyangiaceae bacterium]